MASTFSPVWMCYNWVATFSPVVLMDRLMGINPYPSIWLQVEIFVKGLFYKILIKKGCISTSTPELLVLLAIITIKKKQNTIKRFWGGCWAPNNGLLQFPALAPASSFPLIRPWKAAVTATRTRSLSRTWKQPVSHPWTSYAQSHPRWALGEWTGGCEQSQSFFSLSLSWEEVGDCWRQH